MLAYLRLRGAARLRIFSVRPPAAARKVRYSNAQRNALATRLGDTMGTITTIRTDGLEASVESSGAQLMSLRRDGVEYLWQGDPTWWPRRAPVLFPIVGNLRDGRAESARGEVRLGRHGLARNLEHELERASADSVTYDLRSTPETRERYPFDFELEMTYRLVGGALEQRFVVTNTGDATLPYVVGGHPAFNVPLAAGESFSDYRLEFARPWTCSTPVLEPASGLWDESLRVPLLEDADVLTLTHELLAHDALLLTDVPERTVTLRGPAGHGVRVDFDGFDYLGVWSAANDAPFVAIEPWRGPSSFVGSDDVFEHKPGMDFLEPHESSEYLFRIIPF